MPPLPPPDRSVGDDPTTRCLACGAPYDEGLVVLDLGDMPAADHFPLPAEPGPDPVHPLSMWLCASCGLAQLTRDDTSAEEPLAVEPQALRDQAVDAVGRLHEWEPVARLAATGGVVREFGSPHGGSWLGLLAERGWSERSDGAADLVVDTFGLMHDRDQAAALHARADALSDDGVLVLVFHSLATIVRHRQWSSLRHGHHAYFSTTALTGLLAEVGLTAVAAWSFDLYAGTVALAATRRGDPEESLRRLLDDEARAGVTDARTVRDVLQRAADAESEALAAALSTASRPWHAYGAASRAIAVLQRAGATSDRLLAVADASPGKQGRTVPGSRVPIVSPAELVAADPARVWLLLPDLRREVEEAYPQLRGRWADPVGDHHDSTPAGAS